jgi:predicted nucleic acid-binding protein
LPLVIDASVIASWHFPDEKNAAADAVMDRLRNDDAMVPGHWWFEVRNALLVGERRGRTTPEKTALFLEFLTQFHFSIVSLPDEDVVMTLARRHRLSFYDAAYLELAQREGVPLATFDGDLIAAARAEGVALA